MSLSGLFSNKRKKTTAVVGNTSGGVMGAIDSEADQAAMAGMVLATIDDGVIVLRSDNVITLINPAAVQMIGCEASENALGLDYLAIMHFETGEGMPVDVPQNKIAAAINAKQSFTTRDYVLINMQNQRVPISITVLPTANGETVMIFRNITNELEEEGAQMEFVSTASHEMRTPVASIEGYLGLALNPQTATIDERARKYLEEAHASSQHLGRLFQDLLDVTRLDDKKIRLHMVPVEMIETVQSIAEGQAPAMGAKNLK